MGRKPVDMSELEYSVVSTVVVVVVVVHYTRLAKVAREGTCRFQRWNFVVSHPCLSTNAFITEILNCCYFTTSYCESV